MEVQFTPEQEARLSQIANYNGTPAEQLVKQAALRLSKKMRKSVRALSVVLNRPPVVSSLTTTKLWPALSGFCSRNENPLGYRSHR